MTTWDMIVNEIKEVPEPVAKRILAYVRRLKFGDDGAMVTAIASEEVLARDWLTPEEDAAWVDL